MKWAFFLGSAAVGGGTYVIFEHAIHALGKGDTVVIVTKEIVSERELYWHKRAHNLHFQTIEEAEQDTYDVVISTWWRLVYEAYRLKAKQYIYFVQSIESRFYEKTEKSVRQLAEATYMLHMPIITEASWIKQYLEKKYFGEVRLVHNGIRKDLYYPEGKAVSQRKKGCLRVLVEGPVDVFFKNVPKTVRLCTRSKADEIWLLTSSDVTSFPGVDRVFSRVPIEKTAQIYRSCDVIVKLSYVEGMFGPPLEMFHCGGTAITYDVTGHDEYIVHEVNGLVAKRDDDKKVVEYINRLKDDPVYLQKLKDKALETADQWISWEESSERFYIAVKEFCCEKNRVTRERLKKESEFHYQSYIIAEDYKMELEEYKATFFFQRVWIRMKRKIPLEVKIAIKGRIKEIVRCVWR